MIDLEMYMQLWWAKIIIALVVGAIAYGVVSIVI
jgi:hypothetical protein